LPRQFVGYLIIVQAVYPAFYALYVSQERRTSVQAMQLSNGLTNPVGLWLGHLMFDTITTVILSTVIIIIFATLSDQFHGLGALVCLVSIFCSSCPYINGFSGLCSSSMESLRLFSPTVCP
jgi:hypothetical protein